MNGVKLIRPSLLVAKSLKQAPNAEPEADESGNKTKKNAYNEFSGNLFFRKQHIKLQSI